MGLSKDGLMMCANYVNCGVEFLPILAFAGVFCSRECQREVTETKAPKVVDVHVVYRNNSGFNLGEDRILIPGEDPQALQDHDVFRNPVPKGTVRVTIDIALPVRK